MSWIPNAVLITGTFGGLYSEISRDKALILRYDCEQVKWQDKQLEKHMRGTTTYTFLDGYIIRETEKAIRLNIAQGGHVLDGESFWFPLSQIKSIHRASGSEPDRIEVADWLIEAKINEIAGGG